MDEISQEVKDRYRDKARSHRQLPYFKSAADYFDDHGEHHDNDESKAMAAKAARLTKNREAGISRSYAKEEPRRHQAQYDAKTGTYDILDTQTGQIVDRNVADSGGLAMSVAANWDHRAKMATEDQELDEAGRTDWQAKTRQFGPAYYLNTDCGYASLNDLGAHEYFQHDGVVVLEIDRNGKKGLNYVAGGDSHTAPGTPVTCVTQTSTGQKFRPGKVVDKFTMDEYNNDRAGLEARLAKHGITPTKKLSVKTFD